MRIAIVLKTFTTSRGGAEVWSSSFARWLLRRGHEVHVVAAKASEDVQRMGVAMHLIPTRSSTRFAKRSQALLSQLNVDIVHDMGAGWYFDVFQSHVGLLSQYRAALLRLMPPPKAWLKRFAAAVLPTYWCKNRMMRRQYSGRQDSRYLALSRAIADDLQRVHGIARARINVVPNGVDIARFTPSTNPRLRRQVRASLGAGDESLVLLLVAQNHELKGLPTVLRAAGRLIGNGKDVWLAVVGGRPEAAHIRLINELGISARVNYIGWTDPRPFYQAADVYVHPSHYDACSLAVLEALASGLPVITSSANGASELLQQGETGYVLRDANDVTSLSQHLITLCDLPVRRRMGRRARLVAEANSMEKNFERIEQVYREILAERGLHVERLARPSLRKSA